MWWILVPVIVVCILYTSMVVGFWVGIIRTKQTVFPLNKVPMPISVVVPICNEESNIDNLLHSLSNIDYPKELFEIVLVNDNSTDNGWSKAQEWMGKVKNLVLLELSPEKKGKKHALTLGVSQSLHNIVVLTDADCIHPANWLSEISDNYKHNRWCMLIGSVMIGPTDTLFQKMQSLEYASIMASSLGSCALGFPALASSANLAFTKKTIGFNYQMLEPKQVSGDDVFLLHNIKRKKCNSISYSHSLISLVKTKPVNSIKEFVLQRARWASKAPAYRDGATIFIAAIVFLFNATIVGLAVGTAFHSPVWPILLNVFVLKLIIDFPLLWVFLKNFKETSLLKVYLPLQLVYPIYIMVAFILSLVIPVMWKERN